MEGTDVMGAVHQRWGQKAQRLHDIMAVPLDSDAVSASATTLYFTDEIRVPCGM